MWCGRAHLLVELGVDGVDLLLRENRWEPRPLHAVFNNVLEFGLLERDALLHDGNAHLRREARLMPTRRTRPRRRVDLVGAIASGHKLPDELASSHVPKEQWHALPDVLDVLPVRSRRAEELVVDALCLRLLVAVEYHAADAEAVAQVGRHRCKPGRFLHGVAGAKGHGGPGGAGGRVRPRARPAQTPALPARRPRSRSEMPSPLAPAHPPPFCARAVAHARCSAEECATCVSLICLIELSHREPDRCIAARDRPPHIGRPRRSAMRRRRPLDVPPSPPAASCLGRSRCCA